MLARLFQRPLEREGGHPETFAEELEVQLSRLVPACALMATIAWLPYISHDLRIHPELPVLWSFRVGLSMVGALVFVAGHFGWLRFTTLAYVLGGYLWIAAGAIAGLSGGDTPYVGGFVFALMVAPPVPIPRAVTWTLIGAALAAFVTTGLASGMDLATARGRYAVTDLVTASLVASLLVYLLDRVRYRSWLKSRQIDQDKQRIDELLLNILPRPVADELKAKDTVTPRHYDSVTVVFTDFKGFTMLAERVEPEQLVAELDRCFSRFDEVMDRHGLEKLKTLGDGYLFAGGIPEENATHPVDAVLASLEIARFMEEDRTEREARGEPAWSVRIGVNTGPLTAGVVGHKKFAYDIWGDTVNVASRMESSGEPGRVNVSEATRALVEDFFVTEPRGRVPAKNKGMVEMHFVTGLRPELSVDGLGLEPNEAFRGKRRALARENRRAA